MNVLYMLIFFDRNKTSVLYFWSLEKKGPCQGRLPSIFQAFFEEIVWRVRGMLSQNGIPLYHQLKEIFIEKITSGEWAPGENIPPESQLCKQFGVSRGPVRQALDQLVREGLLARKQGKGSWVLPRKIERELGTLTASRCL